MDFDCSADDGTGKAIRAEWICKHRWSEVQMGRHLETRGFWMFPGEVRRSCNSRALASLQDLRSLLARLRYLRLLKVPISATPPKSKS